MYKILQTVLPTAHQNFTRFRKQVSQDISKTALLTTCQTLSFVFNIRICRPLKPILSQLFPCGNTESFQPHLLVLTILTANRSYLYLTIRIHLRHILGKINLISELPIRPHHHPTSPTRLHQLPPPKQRIISPCVRKRPDTFRVRTPITATHVECGSWLSTTPFPFSQAYTMEHSPARDLFAPVFSARGVGGAFWFGEF